MSSPKSSSWKAVLFRAVTCSFLLALAGPAFAQRGSPFMEEFRKLIPTGNLDAMVELVKTNEQSAELAIVETCEAIGQESNDVLEEEVDALRKAWKKGYDSDFVDLEYNYFSLDLQGAFKKSRRDLVDQYRPKLREYGDVKAKKEPARLASLAMDFYGFAKAFEELGDLYLASLCYGIYAEAFDVALMGNQADFKRACEGWKKNLELREKLELDNQKNAEIKKRIEFLEAEGHGAPATPAPGAPAAPGAPESATGSAPGVPVPLNAVFELVSDIEMYARPAYHADVNYQIWPAIVLQGVDSKGSIPTMERSPGIVRISATKIGVDVNGDGTGEVEVPLTGKIGPVQLTLGEGDQQRPWAFLATIGQQQDTYQGFRYNLSADENQMQVFVNAAASMVGTVDGIRVQVIDENMDGVYGGPPTELAYIGVREGSAQRDVDTVVIGETKVARPWSELQKIGPNWYKLERDPTGALLATRTDVKAGTLALDLKGVDANWLILRGTGNLSRCFFDVVDGGVKKVEVPEGTYELYCGLVSSGKRTQMAKALVLPGTTVPTVRAIAGETMKVELGAPFGFDFKYTQDEETISVEGSSIVVSGRGGESYQRLWNCVPIVEVNVRKAGSGKGKKEEKMQPVGSQEELIDAGNDYRNAWFPLSAVIQKPKAGETVELQLVEKKNKLFGKIESTWK